MRLLAGLLAVIVLGLVGSFLTTSALLQQYLRDSDRQTLAATAQRARALFARGPQTLDAEQLGTLLGAPFGAIIVGPDGRAADTVGSGDEAPAALLALTAAIPPGEVVRYDPGERADLLAIRIPSPGVTVVHDDGRAPTRANAVILSVDADINDSAVHKLLREQALVVLVTVALAALLTLLVLRVGLRPLRRMAATAEAIASGALRRRLPTERGGPETAQLATAVNRAFDAQAAAEDKIRAFAADASHELRTPLATISGWLDLYNQGSLATPQELDRALGRIDAEAGRMRLLVEELSLLARLDAGRTLRSDEVDLVALAEAIVDDARVVDRERAIELVADGAAWVRGDEPRLAQVLRNLVGNAVQHTPAEASVRVALIATPDEVVVRVSDTGPGIPPEQLAHVFERFWRAEGSRSRAHGGSGLGLAIVDAIVRSHGGSVRATSVAGEGSTFTVTLPRLR